MRTRRLIVVTPEGERELLFIGRLTVGRAPECDISVADTKISRRHAEFDASGPTPRVSDLGSRNGILVNGRKVGAADLAPGDVVTVGDARIRFEERAAEPDPSVVSSGGDDRTAILAPLMPPVPGAMSEPAPPHAAVLASMLDGDPEKTSVLTPRASAATAPPSPTAPPAAAAAPPVVPPAPPAPPVPAAPPAVDDPAGDRTLVLSPPSRPVVAPPPPVMAPPPVAPPPVAAPAPVVAAPPPAAPVAQAPPVSTVAAAPAVAAGAAVATGGALKGPKFSWGGLVTLAAVLLGGLAVLLGALPLMSASSSALDALSQRQARTLAGWLAAGVRPGATIVDAAVMESVQSQPGVERAMVLERASGRAVAPASVTGEAFTALPGVGEGWRDLTSARVGRVDAFADAYVPSADGAYIAWVRYERPSTDDTGLAIMVALVVTLVFAMLVALVIKKHTRATLQHFTRQVELAVSGASPKVMQGTLMPGLERLPGVVTYLLERRLGMSGPGGVAAPGLADTDDPALAGGAIAVADPGPPWLEVTPSLTVAEASAHGPASGAPLWATARGRHLLDVLDNGPVRNAVVQGLGALGMQAGAEATVPLPGEAPIALRRETSGHVRVTLGAR